MLEALRKRGSQTLIILLTAKNKLEDEVLGLDLGADDYTTRPFDTPELLARVRSMLRRLATFVSETLTVGDCTLDRSNYLLAVNGQALPLINKNSN